MRCLILAAGNFDDGLRAEIAAGREPRLDVFELARVLGADKLDFGDVERSSDPMVKLAARTAGNSAAVALLGFKMRAKYDAFFTTGEDIGLPLALLLKPSSARCSHTMIAHTLFPQKKQAFFQYARVGSAIDRVLVYSTSEERLAIDTLGLPAAKVERLYYHADQQFFRPDTSVVQERGLVCAAGQLLRDYDTLVEAVRDLPLRVQIAAGSPWIERPLQPRAALPPNVTWGKLNRFDLRALCVGRSPNFAEPLPNWYRDHFGDDGHGQMRDRHAHTRSDRHHRGRREGRVRAPGRSGGVARCHPTNARKSRASGHHGCCRPQVHGRACFLGL